MKKLLLALSLLMPGYAYLHADAEENRTSEDETKAQQADKHEVEKDKKLLEAKLILDEMRKGEYYRNSLFQRGKHDSAQAAFDALSNALKAHGDYDLTLLGGETISHVAAQLLTKNTMNGENTRLAMALFNLHAENTQLESFLNQCDTRGRTPKSILEKKRDYYCSPSDRNFLLRNDPLKCTKGCNELNKLLPTLEKQQSDKKSKQQQRKVMSEVIKKAETS